MTAAPPSPVAPTPATLAPSALAGPRAAAPSLSAESLSAERAILDQARSDIASGDAAGALVLLEDHARRFRKPQLSEEREALAIQSLVALAQYDEARARAARFREASPNSLFVPAIETALASIP
jgi:outer membrane protein assembly factor BamD (BamD/ComL family)